MSRLSLTDLLHSYTHDTVKIPDEDLAVDHFCKSLNSIVDKPAPFEKYKTKNMSSLWLSAELSFLLIKNK